MIAEAGIQRRSFSENNRLLALRWPKSDPYFEVDANRNGKIDLEEFYILMGRKYDNNDKEAEMRAGILV